MPDLSSRNGAQLLELGKVRQVEMLRPRLRQSQWSPAFRAGKSSKYYRIIFIEAYS